MKILMTGLVCVATFSSSSKSSSNSEELSAGEVAFNDIKLQYGKKYKPADERGAFENFLINLAIIKIHNA